MRYLRLTYVLPAFLIALANTASIDAAEIETLGKIERLDARLDAFIAEGT